jgi:exodeoxyribonuclease VII large subunit
MVKQGSLSLYEINTLIREVLQQNFYDEIWVRAEIARIAPSASRHCYLELIDKETPGKTARGSAVIWGGLYVEIANRFERLTGVKLQSGIKIMMLAQVQFHQEYGLKLIIKDIDPAYTLGEMALKKQEILARLAQEGLIYRNKSLPFPLVPQKIAVISSKTAAGFQDFIRHLEASPYAFSCELFESLMQGDRVEAAMLIALERCKTMLDEFDLVVIVRGGGGKAELHCFDNYALGKAIALFPLPVVSGIGHERDASVVDEVAYMSVKTPTAAADFILAHVKNFDESIDNLLVRAIRSTIATLDYEKVALSDVLKNLVIKTERLLKEEAKSLIILEETLKQTHFRVAETQTAWLAHLYRLMQLHIKQTFKIQHVWLNAKLDGARHLDPKETLKRGYSITCTEDGNAVKASGSVVKDQLIKTILFKGELLSRIEACYGDKENDL